MMRFIIAILLLTFLLCGSPHAESEHAAMAISEARELLAGKPENLVVLDVRTPGEFAAGHLDNARNMDFFGPRFETEIEKLPKNAEILVYCRSGRRSEAATEILRNAGYDKAFSLEGGIDAWTKAGGKLIKDEADE